MRSKRFHTLLELLRGGSETVIQTHDYPDHDAVAAGFALHELLKVHGQPSRLCYSGSLLSGALRDTVMALNIPLVSSGSLRLGEKARIVLVDGFEGNTNVSDLSGSVVAVIDHHVPPVKPRLPFSDIRPNAGACSTIIHGYYRETDTPISVPVATSLILGIMIDTAHLTRGVSAADLRAFSALFPLADHEIVTVLLNSSLCLEDLSVFSEALSTCTIMRDVCFLDITKSIKERPEVLGMAADFFLRLREVSVVIAVSREKDIYRVSIRSDDLLRPANHLIMTILAVGGSGGGHAHMAGGFVPKRPGLNLKSLRSRFIAELGMEDLP